jgi:hypothetical protein
VFKDRSCHKCRRLKLVGLGVLAALAITALASAPAQAIKEYGGEFWWGCTYSWGSPCIEPRYETAVNYLMTFDSQRAHEFLPGDETENRYPAPSGDGKERCMSSAVWNGSQVAPWVNAWDYVAEAPGGMAGYGMIGTCEPYTDISVYQYVNWGEY